MNNNFTSEELRRLDALETKSNLRKLNNLDASKEEAEYISTVFSKVAEVCKKASVEDEGYYDEKNLSPIHLCACRQVLEKCEQSLNSFYDNLSILTTDNDFLDRFFADFFKLADILLDISYAEPFPDGCVFDKNDWVCNLEGLSKFEALLQVYEKLKKWVELIRENFYSFSLGMFHFQSWLFLFIIPIDSNWHNDIPVKVKK